MLIRVLRRFCFMNKRYKQKWIAKLRSGEYPQTTQTLRDKNGFCCLGVLCETSPVAKTHYFNKYKMPNDRTMDDCLESRHLKMFGLTEDIQQVLTDMNDVKGKSFTEIADYIEKNL